MIELFALSLSLYLHLSLFISLSLYLSLILSECLTFSCNRQRMWDADLMFFYSSVLYRNTCNHFPNSLAFTSVMCVSFRIIMGRFKSERTAPVMRLKTGLVVWFEVRPFFTACVTHSQPDSNLANQSQFKATIVWLMKPPLPRLQFIVPGSRIYLFIYFCCLLNCCCFVFRSVQTFAEQASKFI